MKLRFKTRPRPYQVKALKRMIRQGGGGLFVPMRWGKTWVAIYFCVAMYYKRGVRRVLVVTVTSGLGVWLDQIAEHCPVPWQVIDHEGELLAQGGDTVDFRARQPIEMNGHYLQFMLVNYQNVYARETMDGHEWIPVDNATLKLFRGQVVVLDESHHVGNPTSVQTQHCRMHCRAASHRLLLTGSPFHRKPFYVFGQALCYDDGKTFGTAWGHFKKRVAVMGGFGNYEVKRYRNLGWMTRTMKTWAHIEKYVPPGEPVVNVIHFNLHGDNMQAYLDMATDRVLEVEGETVMSEIILSVHLRLQQICGGFIKLPSGKYASVGTSKLDILEDRLQEYMAQGIHKAVIGCRFIPELRAVAKVAKRVGYKVVLFHGGIPKGEERARRIRAFTKTKQPCLFISQIATGSQAIDLSAADTMLFYSLSESYLHHDQFSKRIEMYEDTRRLMYDYLIARGTRDEVTYQALMLKQDVATFIVDRPKYVERITAATEGQKSLAA